MSYSIHVTVNYPDNTEKDIPHTTVLNEPVLMHWLWQLVKEESQASSFVITIVKQGREL